MELVNRSPCGYAKEGARVVLADIDEEKGKRLEEELKKNP